MSRLKRWLMTASLALAGLMAVLPVRAELILVAGPAVTGTPGQTVIVEFELVLDLAAPIEFMGLDANFAVLSGPLGLPSDPQVILAPVPDSTLQFYNPSLSDFTWSGSWDLPQSFPSDGSLLFRVPVHIDALAGAGSFFVGMNLLHLTALMQDSLDFDFPLNDQSPLEARVNLIVEQSTTAVDSPAPLLLLACGLGFFSVFPRHRQSRAEAFALRSGA